MPEEINIFCPNVIRHIGLSKYDYIKSLVKKHKIFKDYSFNYSLENNFYIVSNFCNNSYIGFTSSSRTGNMNENFFRKTRVIDFDELMFILEDSPIKRAKSISIRAVMTMEFERI